MLISVITPSLNQGKFLEHAIRSVACQASGNCEHIVTDGGSQDESSQVAARYGGRIKWISETDRGQAHAVNKGILLAQGDIIGWLNADDICLPGTLPFIERYFSLHPEAEIVYGEAHIIDANGKRCGNYRTEDWEPRKLRKACGICQPAVFLRKSVFQKHGLLNERLHYCMDYEYWLRLADGGVRAHRVKRFLAGSRTHANTKTLSRAVEVHEEILAMLQGRYGKVPESWLVNYQATRIKQAIKQRDLHLLDLPRSWKRWLDHGKRAMHLNFWRIAWEMVRKLGRAV